MRPRGRYRFLTLFDTVQVDDLCRIIKFEDGSDEISAHAEKWDPIRQFSGYEHKGKRILGYAYHEICEFWEVIRRVE